MPNEFHSHFFHDGRLFRHARKIVPGLRLQRGGFRCHGGPAALPPQFVASRSDRRKIIGRAGASGARAAQFIDARADRCEIVGGAGSGHDPSAKTLSSGWLVLAGASYTTSQLRASEIRRRAVPIVAK
jgi:hypothetical protein